ncbi:M12 family metallopeptidase [Bradyrhizobium prioriisuperbiae]|uniref:M12 family metallopeptidase n=1 Tax=Bradyrhizobium prioriisuperbiae TaxID=2854389 RepID=UPI0028EC999F|nr:M12 family metallopeptidase [Bradyrhizobium prioritasuperba]
MAQSLAVDENPRNQTVESRGANAEALSLTEKKWNPDRRTLSVDFIDSPPFIDKVIKAAVGWHDTMSLRFQFGKGSPDILVSFVDGGGSWSYIGTDSKYYAGKSIPSMNFGWFNSTTPDNEFRRTTLHEFGHALSLIHEHQHPGSSISWKKDAVYAYYSNLGWDSAKVDQNIFGKYDITQVNGSAYDRTSIMHYPIPAELVMNPTDVVGWNDNLSPNDRVVMASLYKRTPGKLPT